MKENANQEQFKLAALGKTYGYDGGLPGTESSPSIWLFGLEPGAPVDPRQKDLNGDGYSVDTQLRWDFNKSAFKLLAVVAGCEISEAELFARRMRIFEQGSPGYFKGNLFPYPCHTLNTWDEKAKYDTGFEAKQHYAKWCREARFTVIRDWINECQPRLFIGVGVSGRRDFASVVFRPNTCLEKLSFSIEERNFEIYHASENGRQLFVLPHFTNRFKRPENAALIEFGNYIRGRQRKCH